MAQNLYALLVAINEYDQEGIKDLSGCENDLEGMLQYLKSHCERNDNIHFYPKILINKNATRNAVIKGFNHFNKAVDGDICVFFFSGHGGRVDLPREFSMESDGMLEAIVCRSQDKNDNLIIDKELSFLIEKATRKKDVHFIMISDSCHSGSNSKSIDINVRSISDNFNTRKVDDYLGRKSYREINDKDGKILSLKAPVGKHFKLSACMRTELSKEKTLGDDSKIRGVFTYALLQVLEQNGNNINYANLMTKVKILVATLAKDQTPQMETIKLHPQDQNRIFLNGLLAMQQPTFQLQYDADLNTWKANTGSVYGVKENDFLIVDKNTEIEIKEVFPTHSIVDPGKLIFFDRRKIYDVSVKYKSVNKLNLHFSKNVDADIAQLIGDQLTGHASIEINPKKQARYIVRTEWESISLTHPDDDIPIFARVNGHDLSSVRLFISLVEKVWEWHNILSIQKPNSTIRESELMIRLSDVESPYTNDDPDTSTAKEVSIYAKEIVFRYHFYEGSRGAWHPPFFRLSIENKSNRSFWVSALYCGAGFLPDGNNYVTTSFSISNQFLEKEQLRQRSIAKMIDRYVDRNTPFESESIQLSILDDYFEQGYNEIKDVIKIFVSTEEMDTSVFNRPGIPIDHEGTLSPRPTGRSATSPPPQPDWKTFEIPVTIVKPRDLGWFAQNQNKTFFGTTLEGHQGFSARILLSTMEEFIRTTETVINEQVTNMPKPEVLLGIDQVYTVPITDGIGTTEGCKVIEFYQIGGAKTIHKKDPLNLVPNEKMVIAGNKVLVCMGYSAEKRNYVFLGKPNKQGIIPISKLPNLSPSLVNGLGMSVKLFLLRVDKKLLPLIEKLKI